MHRCSATTCMNLPAPRAIQRSPLFPCNCLHATRAGRLRGPPPQVAARLNQTSSLTPAAMPPKDGYTALETAEEDELLEGVQKIPGGERAASGWLSKLTFWWANGAVTTGYSQRISEEQMWELAEQDTIESCTQELHQAWVSETDAHKGEKRTQSDAAKTARGEGPAIWKMPLGKAFWRVHGPKYKGWLFVKLANDFNQAMPAILLNKILSFLQDEAAAPMDGFVLVIAAFCLMMLKAILENLFFFHMMRIAMQIKVAIVGVVYRKVLRLSPTARAHHTEGEIVNLMQQDSERLMWFIPLSPMLISASLQVVLNSVLLFYFIGVTSIVGIAILFSLIPINRVLVGMQMKLRFATQKHTDERVKVVNEMLKGIRVVKCYAWEQFMEERVNEIRGKEIHMIRTRSILGAMSNLFMWSAPPFATVAVFVAYTAVGHEMNEAALPKVFTALMLFNNLRFPLMMLPWMLTMYGDAKVSMGRLEQYLMREELPEQTRQHMSEPGVAIRVTDGRFQWRAAPKKAKKNGPEGAWGGGGGGGDQDDGPPSLKAICISDGIGKICVWWTGPWSSFKKRTVVPFFCALSLAMVGYWYLLTGFYDTVPNEETLSLVVAAIFLLFSIFLAVVKQAKPTAAEDDVEVDDERGVDYALEMDLTVKTGDVVMVIGSVGAGKTSVLSAILGEMEKTHGRVEFATAARVSYCSQQAWLGNCSLKENITYTNPLDEERYQHVLDLVSLRQDLRELPNGDRTEIGERGINLSGGQKARVAIARAMYNEADIYIFDDVLSALDAHVGKHVFESCIGELRDAGRTVILATNQLHVLPKSDLVVFIKHEDIGQGAVGAEDSSANNATGGKGTRGWLGNTGTFTQLMNDTDFAKLMEEVGISEEDFERATPSPRAAKAAVVDAAVTAEGATGDGKADAKLGDTATEATNRKPDGKDLTEVEEREEGVVAWSVYAGYLKMARAQWFFVFTIFFVITGNLTQVLNDMWLTWWTQDAFELPQWEYELLYIASSLLYASCTFSTALIWAYVGIYGSRNIHNALLSSVVAQRMSWFDTTPVGRIVSRFAKDIAAVDERLAMMFNGVIGMYMIMAQTFVVIGVITGPSFLVCVSPVLVLYWHIQKVYKVAALQYKRIESVTRSPIYNYCSETLAGISTIRAFEVCDETQARNAKICNVNTQATFICRVTERWLAMRLEGIGNCIVLVAGLLGVASKGSGVYSGLVGIALVYGMRITQLLSWAVRQSTELAVQMNSVERLLHYVNSADPEEKQGRVSASGRDAPARPPNGWPSRGQVEFCRLSMRYRPGLELVLQELDFVVEGGTKVGICGRTGAGKSSLMLALFRMVEPASGCIKIDGIDTTTLSLKSLRSALAIIPQDPVLFSGTVKFNLDPENLNSEGALWSVLQRVHLDGKIKALDGGLDAIVSEGGDSFSVGQRQLICMARALLRNSAVLLMDEATSSVDIETDSMIQELVREEFRGRTTLTIAHRLNTIIDYDNIVVVDAGRVAEMDSPKALLQDSDSKFSSLVRGTGADNEEKLRMAVGLGPVAGWQASTPNRSPRSKPFREFRDT